MTIANVVLASIAMVGCAKNLPSIKPEQRVETYLAVPAHDHFYNVVAGITVPVGYELVQGDGIDFDFWRRNSDPRIEIVSTQSRPLFGNYEPDMSRLSGCQSSDLFEARVLLQQPRVDGGVVVCRLHDQHRYWGTFVHRNYHWRDQWFQCTVAFRVDSDWNVPNDEGKPSDARLADAIAICDSFSVREMTDADLKRLFPTPLGQEPFYPPTR